MTGKEGALIRQTNGLIIDNVTILPEQGEAFTIAPTVENIQRL